MTENNDGAAEAPVQRRVEVTVPDIDLAPDQTDSSGNMEVAEPGNSKTSTVKVLPESKIGSNVGTAPPEHENVEPSTTKKHKNSKPETYISKERLEQQYMRLLERRITQLEKLVWCDGDLSENSTDPSDAHKVTADDEEETTAGAEQIKGQGEDAGHEDGEPKDGEPKDGKAKDGETKDGEASETKKEPEAEKPVARVRHVIARWNEDTTAYDDEDAAKVGEDAKSTDAVKEKAKDGSKPTIFRRVMEAENPKKISYDEIEISSPELKRIYYSICATLQTEDSIAETPPVSTHSPFHNFIWYWDQFEEACLPVENDSEERAAAREDLKQLMALIRKSQAEPYFKIRDASLSKGTMPFDYLWTLFAPGSKVCAKTFMDEMQMLEVRNCTIPELGSIKLSSKEFRVYCCGFDWDGVKFAAFDYSFTLTKSSLRDGTQIDSLEMYPMRYHRNETGLRQDLLKRGKRFWSMCKPDKFQYDYNGAVLAFKTSKAARAHMLAEQEKDDGDTMSTFSGLDDNGSMSSSRKDYSGQVIVDAYSFLRAQEDPSSSEREPPLGERAAKSFSEYECFCKYCTESSIKRWQTDLTSRPASEQYIRFADKGDKLSEERLTMCPPRVLGYALKSKTWAQFQVVSCKEVSSADKERKDYFQNQLQLNDTYKKMLLAFVNNHQSSRPDDSDVPHDKQKKIPKSLDVIEGKGKGLAILLHGPPGVGKTLTAETIALATSRPLLVVSVAEVGTKAANAESRLNIFFAIAARWGAILLIDEADVFLEERTKSDNPERNMLVSVLLRSLEYYEGIIFLTTNRIRSIDVAVQSRMHLAIQYKRLAMKQKIAIYHNLLGKVPDDLIKGDRERLYSLVDDMLCRRNEMNGRQIRNIVSAALALAKERGNPHEGGKGDARLRFEDLRRVHETTTDFLESLKDTTNKARARNEVLEEEDEDERD